MDPSRALLQRYLTESSESSFRELVERHADLVYQVALRRAGGDHAMARDAAQVVFTELAQKAGSLPAGTVIAGWLHRHTGFVTAKLIRTEQRRRQREHTAAMETPPHTPSDVEALWHRLAPVLDEALGRLSAADRDALVLRFLEGRDLREVGGMTGTSENSARMRVSRALEKLRRVLHRRGITSTTLALGTSLGMASQSHAPAGLPQALAAAALQASPAAAATGLVVTNATWPWWGKAAMVLGSCGVILVSAHLVMNSTAAPPRAVADRIPPPHSGNPVGPAESFMEAVLPTADVAPLVVATTPATTAVTKAEPVPAAPEGAVKLKLGVVPAVMRFDPATLEVKAGQRVMLLFVNGKCPLQHNFLLINPGKLNDVGALADRMLADPLGMTKHYLPTSPEILAVSNQLIGIGQSDLIEFTAPAQPGDYPYLCTFPGHWRPMNGILKVVP